MITQLNNIPSLPSLNVLGLMSGTSLDGLDICLSQIVWKDHFKFDILHFQTYTFPKILRDKIYEALKLDTQKFSLQDLCELNFELGDFFAKKISLFCHENNLDYHQIDLIGSHGQTFFHQPPDKGHIASTLQMGEASLIAARTGITTIADFRPTDMAWGGQGAPLIPFLDILLFRHCEQTIVTQNIGGIANLTYLPDKNSTSPCLAFDTGPGNMLIDYMIYHGTDGQLSFDKNGEFAAKGKVQPDLLNKWLKHPYYSLPIPKSTGRELFGSLYAQEIYQDAREHFDIFDILATVTALTARTISNSYRDFLPTMPDKVIMSGGGVHNQTLMKFLKQELPGVPLHSMEEVLNLPSDAKEAFAFAALAYTSLFGIANNVTSVTGATELAILGKIIPGKNYLNLLAKVSQKTPD